MEARPFRAAILAAGLFVSMGARYRTPNFIVETAAPKLAQQVGAAAEKYRRELAVTWLGKAMPNWAQPCVMTVHCGPRLGAGGATSFVFDHGEVFGWRMTIQGPRERILDSVLPHEITHMIFASHFRRPLPRWADEGAATSVEHVSERTKHRKMLYHFLRTGRGIAFNQMFAMKHYPRDIMPLYAQGYSLAEFLIQLGGRRKYVEFLGDGLETGDWSGAIKRRYGIDGAGALQNTWLAWVKQGSPPLKPRPSKPGAQPSPKMLAGKGRLPRPEPNLLLRIPKQQPAAYAPGSIARAQSPDRTNPRPGPSLKTKPLPSSGWYAAGTRPRRPTPTTPSQAPPSERIRNHLTRPQPIEPPRQMILEWGGN